MQPSPVKMRSTLQSSAFALCLGLAGFAAITSCQYGSMGLYQGTSTLGSHANGEPPRSRDSYDAIVENAFLATADEPLSTFSIDVDTASYANMRRFLEEGSMPPKDSVRIEELINYFDYDYEAPYGDAPFSVTAEIGACPWAPEHRLVHIGLKGQSLDPGELPPRNLVFLLDVSGSMFGPDRLPLLKAGLALLVNQLEEQDTVTIIVYAGAAGMVLEPTSGDNKETIHKALEGLRAGGSTAGGAGIVLAYQAARENFVEGGINRVLMATDGDFNVGLQSRGDLERMIEEQREHGVALSILGFGRGNLMDSQMEMLADKGNGNYAYIDSMLEAKKVLVEQAGSTLVSIAKDVKLQVEFNPAQVEGYRLIGYENRLMANQDFADDTKDAGEIGAGHTVTALYEVIPAGAGELQAKVPALKYQGSAGLVGGDIGDELLTFKVRYKQPMGETSEELVFPVVDGERVAPSDNFNFSAAVAAFGMQLRGSSHKGSTDYPMILELAQGAKGEDVAGYRAAFLQLVDLAQSMQVE